MKTIYVRVGVTTLAALGLTFAGAAVHADTTIAGYGFENLPTLATGSAAAPATITADSGADSGTATLVTGGTGFANVSGDGTTPGYAYTTPGDDVADSSTTVSSYALRLGVGKATSNNGSSLIFSASTVGFNAVNSFSYNTYASSASAFQTQTVGYSTNGGTTFTTLTPFTVPAQGTVAHPTSDAAGYTTETFNLAGITALAENPNAEFEIVFSGAPTYAGTAAPNDRLDNVSINGTADASPAPEPAQMAGLAFFLLGVSALAYRARKRANEAA